MNFSRILVIAGLVMVGILSRLLPHPPNFTSLNAMALFSAFYLGSCWISFATVFVSLILSDLIIGFHSMVPFVYFSFGLIILMGYRLKNKASIKNIAATSLMSSILFFVVTNFGEWFSGTLYPKTLQGLSLCYIAATPFFVTQVLGDLTFCVLLFGLLNVWNKGFKSVKSHCSDRH
jgi:hypothetical protein